MKNEVRLGAMKALRWESIYMKWRKGHIHNGLLQEEVKDDDFEKAFEILANKGKKKVLDIGCAWGYLTRQVASYGFQVKGIDLSAVAIEEAIKNNEGTGMDCTFEQHNFLDFCSDERFDIVLDRGCLCVLNEEEEPVYFKKLKSILNSGGYFILKTDSRKKRNGEVIKLLGLNFTHIASWKSSYIRSDGKKLKTLFYIGKNKE